MALALEAHLEEAVLREGAGVVAIDRDFLIDVVHHQVECAVTIQIAIGGAIGKPPRVQSPLGTHIREGNGLPRTGCAAAVVAEGVVRNRRRAHRVGERQKIDAPVLDRRYHRLIVREEGDVVLRGQIPRHAVGYMDVLVAILIEIGDQRTPAPVRRGDAGQLADVAERSIPVVEMEHVAHELVVIIVLELGLVNVPALERGHRLEAVVVLRQHVGDEDVRPAVVVDVGDVEPHREIAEIRHLPVEHLGKGPITVVEVEVIPLEEVVADIDVWPAILVHVGYRRAEPEAYLAAKDPGLFAHIYEVAAEVAVQLVPTGSVALVPDVAEPEAGDRAEGVVDHIQVQ